MRSGRFPRYSYADLENDGYRFIRSPASYDIAAIHAIGFGVDGKPSGGADIVYGVGVTRLVWSRTCTVSCVLRIVAEDYVGSFRSLFWVVPGQTR